jgi:hypothetical protein
MNVKQRAPLRPQGAESDPKHSIKVRQYRPLTFALICRELKPQSGILEGNGLMTAKEESDESKDGQDNCWHVASIVNCIAFAVNLLRPDTLMANNRSRRSVKSCYVVHSAE